MQFNNVYKNKKILLTGHTGFKGSWLALWLQQLGATVVGVSLKEPVSEPNHFDLLKIDMVSEFCDIRNKKELEKIFEKHQPEMVFHLAAQALVLPSYENPFDTFDTNILGTLNILEISRQSKSVNAIVNVTSDKVYENNEHLWGYREYDKLGGKDPYSASKAAVEILSQSYRESFFKMKNPQIYMANCRAGNVIGGGDWAKNRLIPDLIKSATNKNKVEIRNPNSTRPWQHVLEPLSGYLLVGEKLINKQEFSSDSWNFGPLTNDKMNVQTVIANAQMKWPEIRYQITEAQGFHEAKSLSLDCSKAINLLNWAPVWDTKLAIEMTIDWYKEFVENGKIKSIENLNAYIECAKNGKAIWTN